MLLIAKPDVLDQLTAGLSHVMIDPVGGVESVYLLAAPDSADSLDTLSHADTV